MSEGIWNLDPIIELPFLWLLLLSPHWYVSNSIPSHKKLFMVSANVYHISFWVWTCVILLRPQHDGLSRAGFAHLVGCYTLCSAKQTWPHDLGKVCVLQLDRSQSLFYFVPQEKRLIWRPCWGWKNMGESFFHQKNGPTGMKKPAKSRKACTKLPWELAETSFRSLFKPLKSFFWGFCLNCTKSPQQGFLQGCIFIFLTTAFPDFNNIIFICCSAPEMEKREIIARTQI